MATIEELERRIQKLEERILIQDKAIRRILDFVQKGVGGPPERKNANPKQSEENREWLNKESSDRMNRIMEELGYKVD